MTAIDRSLSGTVPDDDAEDSALLERLRAGQDAAFGELFARHSTAVRRLAFGLVNDRSEAEDLTAEAFFRVLQAIRRGAGPVDNVRAYLLIVARRVAWEWRSRRRDVPVSDEELSNRAGAYPDTAGASTERNLITRAFTSLPERWRSVLWKVEVEGERPAVVATNFGLSANATAALARRARQGLRAAYLQAHLAADQSSTACRDVLEKLGAYTAGSITGSECGRIRTHLTGCASCATMHAELRDVCSSLRAHAGVLTVPVIAVTGWLAAPATTAGGLGATIKAHLAGAKLQVALAASSVAALGVVGVVAGSWGADGAAALDELDGKRGLELVITVAPPGQPSSQTIVLTTGALSTAAVVPARPRRSTKPATPDPESAIGDGTQVVYRQTSVEQRTEVHGTSTQVYETTSVTEVNAADQTTVHSHTTGYATPATGGSAGEKSEVSPASEPAATTPELTTTTTANPATRAPTRAPTRTPTTAPTTTLTTTPTPRASPPGEKATTSPGKSTARPPQSHQP